MHASPVATTTINEASAGTGASATLTVNPQVATSFSLVAQATVTVFNQDSITITWLDQVGNTFTGYCGTANLSSTADPNLVYSSANPIIAAGPSFSNTAILQLR
jgi:hypothetical protein